MNVHKHKQRGMTLIELVIVLALLAGLAGMALTSVGEINSRTRYDETQRRIAQVRLVLAGDGAGIGRFVRDMGRMPQIITGTEGRGLAELWSQESNEKYDIVSESISWPSDPSLTKSIAQDVTLHCGWNGPYIDVGGNDALFDGFGNEFVLSQTDGALGISSYGSDGTAGGELWDEADIGVTITLPETSLSISVMGLDSTTTPPVWQPVQMYESWISEDPVEAGDLVVIVIDGAYYLFTANTSGTTGTTSPDTANIGSIGDTMSDGDGRGVEWTYTGPASRAGQFADRLRIAVCTSRMNNSSKEVPTVVKSLSGSGLTGDNYEMEGDSGDTTLLPGIVKVYAYSYIDGENIPHRLNGTDQPMAVELTPGANHITLYLR